jgi:uncharacterized protein YggU (UPF0235/DUF167 family)
LLPPSITDLPFAEASGGSRIAVRLTPRGRADRIDGIAHLADGTAVLKIAVTAPPEDGRANEALLKLLAKELRLPRRDFAVVAGATGRNKLVYVRGEPENTKACLVRALSAAADRQSRRRFAVVAVRDPDLA